MKVQKLRFYGIASLALLMILGSCAGVEAAPKKSNPKAKAPEWYFDLNASFPSAKYLAAVGGGDTRRGAEADASGALARLFNVHVKADSMAQQRYAAIVNEGKSSNESSLEISQTVGTQANEVFVNLRFSDPFADDSGTTHVVAYLEREPTAALYRTAIKKDLARVEDFSARAKSSRGALHAFALYDAAYQVGLNAERMLEQLRIIHAPSARLLESELELQRIAAARDAEAEKLTYRLAIDGDEEGKIAGFVRTALASQSLSFKPDGELAVRGSWAIAPVQVNPKFKSVRWTLNISLSDESGAAIANAVKESRENGIGESEARALAYREAQKFLSNGLTDSLQDYLTRSVLK